MSIHSQLSEVDKLPTEEERVAKLKSISSKHIKEILSFTYDENITWLLPDTDPPYKPCQDKKDKLESRLLQEMRSMPIFLSFGPYANMKQSKREQIFIDILQTISPDDAELLLSIKNRKLPFENFTKETAEKAFPLLAEKWKKRA